MAWLPPFLVGLSAVVAAEVSLGLLLYSGPRLLPSLTLVLATLLGALGAGLWAAPGADPERLVEATRRRWLMALLSFTLGAATAGAWSTLGGLASAAATRGLGLAFLAALPLFACGAVLGAIGVARSGAVRGVAAPAALGAAVGAVFTGLVLVPSLVPGSLYVFCLVALSAAALVHGRVLDRRPEEHLVDEERSLFGVVRVTDRVWGSKRQRQRRLTVGGRLVGGTEDGGPLRAWEGAVADWLVARAAGSEPPPVLLLGASAVALQERLERIGSELVVVERNPVVWRMTVRHFGRPRSSERLRVVTGDPMDLPLDGVGPVGVVVADGAAVRPGDAVPLPPRSLLQRLRHHLPAGGVLVLGGEDPDVLRTEEAARALRELLERAGFPAVAAFGDRRTGGTGRVLVIAGGPEAGLPAEMVGLERLALPGPAVATVAGRDGPIGHARGGDPRPSPGGAP